MEGICFYVTPHLSVRDMLIGHGNCIPCLLRLKGKTENTFGQNNLFRKFEDKEEQGEKANLSPTARAYLAALGLTDPDADPKTAGLIWMQALAVGYAPAYLTENADGIRQDWPRVPLPDTAKALLASARLGREIAVMIMARRLATIVLMEPALNANYQAAKDSCYPWLQS